jgi:hypothetical protein
MKTTSSKRTDLLIILLLTTFGFLFWIGALFSLWFSLILIGVRVDFLAMTEALSTAVATAGLLSAGFIAYREIKAQDISRHIEIADRLYSELNSRENIRARRWVFQQLPTKPEEGVESLNEEGREAVKTVLNSLDRVAFLTQGGWIPEETIMPWMNPMIVKSWVKLGPYIKFEAERRNEPDYYAAARGLAERCLEWRARQYPGSEITWLEDAL